MIDVTGVVKSFGEFRALDNLNMHVPDGAVYGLVGPNGAGKSTIIRHLSGVYRPDSGEITVDGERVYENPKVKSRMACIPDDVYYFPQASIRDMMKFYRGIYPKFDSERYEKLKEVFEIDEKSAIRRLSKGMQKQAAFWLTMCTRPEILILDEPVDGLDPVMRRRVWSIVMSDVAENGMTVLVSSHNLRELEDVCDHVGIMHEGRLLLERSLSQLQENIAKIQIVLADGAELPEGLNILHESKVGRISTIIVRGEIGEISERLSLANPLFFDVVPLTLEEIFIYELGGVDYAVSKVIL